MTETIVMTDHKPLVILFKKNCGNTISTTTINTTQNSPVKIGIWYKPGPNLCKVDWMSKQNHTENRDNEIAGGG